MSNNIQRVSFSLLVALIGLTVTPVSAQASYWLVIGSYRQGPGSRPEVSGITSPSLYAIPMETLELCKEAGKKITEDIYQPVWQFDNRWTCVFNGKNRNANN